MTILQIASDLHIEHTEKVPDPKDYIIPTAEILVLAGDIGSLYRMNQLRDFLLKLSGSFQAILYIPGNHEFYTMPNCRPVSYKALETRLLSLEQSVPNLHILNRNSVRIKNTCIVGCTLWSKPKCVVPPFIVRVHGLNTAGYAAKHDRDLRYIKKMMKYCNREKYDLIVVTHHPPSYRALIGAKKKKHFDSLYASNLDYLLDQDATKLWICGHTHKNIDFISDKGCRVVTNQKGKPKDRIKDYSKSFEVLL